MVERRVLVAESEATVRRLIVHCFQRGGYEVLDVADPLQAKEKAAAADPDLLVVELGGRPGFEPLTAVREESDVAFIGMLRADDDADEATALDLGADDCLSRPVSMPLLLARSRAVLRRKAPGDARQLRFGELMIDLASRSVLVANQAVDLTAKEFDLLSFLASRAGEVFSREELLVAVWRSSAEWQQRETVTEHVHRIRNRLASVAGEHGWIATVRGVGYRFTP
jgi:two-component system phosphate regulon response regulator PhoB